MKPPILQWVYALLLPGMLFLAGCEADKTLTEVPTKKKKKTHLVEVYQANIITASLSRERTGTLRFRREVKIFNQEEGQIIKLPYYEGDKIKKGDIVAKLDDSLLQAQLRSAKASRLKSESDLKRIKDLQQQNFSSEEELARVGTELAVAKAEEELLKTRLSHTKIAAPFSGLVTQRLADPGSVAEKHTHLLTIADPSSLITEVSVSELMLNKLSRKDNVTVRIDALGAHNFTGQINRIHPTLDPLTRRGIVEVEIKPVPKGARPGQLSRMTLNTKASKRLVIPFSALRRDQDGEYVFVVNDQNKVTRINVLTGARLNEFIEILDGLIDGQRIVSKGFLGLKENKPVKIVEPKED